MKTIPAGITWERTGRNSLICTVRREPEYVLELGDLAPLGLQQQGANLLACYGNLANTVSAQLSSSSYSSRCPCCGSSSFGLQAANNSAAFSLFGGLL